MSRGAPARDHEPTRPPTAAGNALPVTALVGLGMLALGWRLLYLGVARAADLFPGLFLDSRFYAETAAAIRAGHGAGDPPYLLSPLYPYFLALFPSIAAEPAAQAALGVRAVQALVGAGTCVLVARIGARAAGRAVGLGAGLLAALYGPLVHYETSVLVAGLQAFFLTAAVDLAAGEDEDGPAGRRALRWAAAGLALGVSAALRPTGLFVAAALFAALVVQAFRGRRSSRVAALALALGCALPVLPFTIRNVRVSGEPILLSANGGFNFWIGNHAHSLGVFRNPPDLDFEHDPLGLVLVERDLGHEPSYREASAWWRGRALRDIAGDPLRWIGQLGNKLLLFLSPVEIPQLGVSFAWYRDRAWPLGAPIELRGAGALVCLVLAVREALGARRARAIALRLGLSAALAASWWLPLGTLPGLDTRWILIAAIAAPFAATLRAGAEGAHRLRWPLVAFWSYVAAICLFFVTGRYRITIVPLASVLAAVTVREVLALARGSDWRRPGAALGLLGGLALASVASVVLYRQGGPLYLPGSTGGEERHIGMSLVQQGRFEEAIDVYRRALAEREDARTRGNLARALRAAGRTDEALAEYARAIQSNPRDATPVYNLGNLYWQDLKNPKEAERLYRKAIALQPRFAEARFNLGAILLERGEFEEASQEIAEALHLAGPEVPWRVAAEKAFVVARRGVGMQNRPPAPSPSDADD